jgi:oligopeptide/dipeptide ABC transporter ATP-binding protein
VAELLGSPRHPYTKGLLESLPKMEASRGRLDEIQGAVPDPLAFPTGCRFHPRCPRVQEKCVQEEPVLRELEPGLRAACHFPHE